MSIVKTSQEKIAMVHKELSDFILKKVSPVFYPNSAGGMEWIPSDFLERKNTFIIYSSNKSRRIEVRGFNSRGVIIQEGNHYNYKDFKQISIEDLLLISEWLENGFEDVVKGVSISKHLMSMSPFFD